MIERIKVRLFLSLFSFTSFVAFGADKGDLKKADSLFIQQQYTQAMSIYEELYNDGNLTPAMLLKMAFIKDASGDYSDALYFLDQYYMKSADREVVGKIQEIANSNDLSGYQYNDTDYFNALLSKFQFQLTLLLLALLLLLTVYAYSRSRKGEKSSIAFVFQFMLTLALFVLINFNGSKEGIIVSDQTLLRSGPSAGAEPIERIAKGHKVNVLDRDKVWTRIVWDGREVFVRNDKLKII